jgi:RecA-family ATPase
MKEGDLGMIYAARGVGKTWLSMMLAHALAEGLRLGEWDAGELGPQKVLYVDGEMNLADTVWREQQMEIMGFKSRNLTFLHHEKLPEGRHLNLADVGQQEALLAEAKARGAKAVVLDNLSCLFRGVDENDNNEWEKVSPWLLSFRRAGIAVIIIHHEGRNGGGARGASRREDAMHWVIRLERNSGTTSDDGASFTSSFTKCRNCPGRDAPPLEWKVDKGAVECERTDDVEQLVALVRDGFSDCGEIADCTGWSKSRVSKLARRAMNAGRLGKSGREYKITG